MLRRRRPLTEAECYARCYGGPRRIDLLPAGSSSARATQMSGEQLRRQFELRLDGREREAA